MLLRAESADGARSTLSCARPDAWWFGAHPAPAAFDARRAPRTACSDWHFVLPRALAGR